MLNILIVGAGGFIGTVFRYLLGLIPFQGEFPIITMLINLVGSFIIGIVAGFSGDNGMKAELSLFLKTGVCGGFTTFSAFSLETIRLIENHKIIIASAYAVLSVTLCLIGAWLGLLLAEKIKIKS